MAIHSPIFDEKLQHILCSLSQGKTREKIAEEAGNKNWKSVDMYMRRRNYHWDSKKQTYLQNSSGQNDEVQTASPQVEQITSLLAKKGADLRTIAGQLGFKDHKELASYMKSKGYTWDMKKDNYVKEVNKVPKSGEPKVVEDPSIPPFLVKDYEVLPIDGASVGEIQRYLPLLELLENHKERLVKLMVPSVNGDMTPRNIILGGSTMISVTIKNNILQTALDISHRKDISIQEIIESALIEFSQKYGY